MPRGIVARYGCWNANCGHFTQITIGINSFPPQTIACEVCRGRSVLHPVVSAY